MAEEQPQQIGRFRVQDELGRGGFGRVYRAYDPTVGRPVAIKVLTDVSSAALTRFRNEAMVAGNLRHKNIVTVYEYGTYEDLPFLAMEYLEGEDLHQLIGSRKPLTLLDKCEIMAQVADGLHCAHSAGVVHRDMKPANIMVLRDGSVKIMDFGIARLTQTPDATRLTQQGFLIGTLRYMAPEQLAGADFDAQCDIFAYGVIFYELLTGTYPFEAPDAQRLMYKLTFNEPPPIRDSAPEIPDALQTAISRMLHKSREQRYRSVKELQFDTEPIRVDLQRGRATELLVEAQELIARSEPDPAQKLLQEALLLEPGNRTARELWESLQNAPQPRPARPSAERARVHVDHAQRVSQLLADARRELEQQNLTAAYRIVSEALRHDPNHPEAAEFLKTIQSHIEKRQAEQRVAEAIRKAEGLLLIPSYDEAIAILTEAGTGSPGIPECLERVRAEQLAHERKQKFHQEMATAADLLRERQLEKAAECLESLRSEFPDNQDVERLLAYARKEKEGAARAAAVESAAAAARTRAESRDYEGALAVLDGALKTYPGDSGLVRLLGSIMAARAAWERRQAVESAIARAETLRAQKRFAEAIQTIEAALKLYAAEPALLDLRKQLEAELARQRQEEELRRIAQAEEKARAAAIEKRRRALEELQDLYRAALRQSSPSQAPEMLSLAKRIASEFPGDKEIQSAADAPIGLLSDIGRARKHLADGDFQAVLELCERRLVQHPDHPAFSQCKQEAGHIRKRAALKELQQRAASESDLEERARLLELGLEQYPGEAAIAAALRFTRNQLALAESIAQAARSFERSGEWDEALEKWSSLRSVYERYPGLGAEIERVTREAGRQAIAPQPQQEAGLASQIVPRSMEAGPRTVSTSAAPASALEPAAPVERSRARPAHRRALVATGVGAALSAGAIGAFLLRGPGHPPVSVTPAPPATVSSPGQSAPKLAPPVRAGNGNVSPPRQTTAVRKTGEKAPKLVPSRPPGPLEISAPPPAAQVKPDTQPAADTVRILKPALPDPRQLEAQEWSQVANSTNPDDLDTFARNHPGASHAEQARNRAAELRQQIRAAAAQQADQAAWERVDTGSHEQLQNYLARFPLGAHVQDARARIADIERQASEALASQRLREQKEQEQARRTADEQAIVKTLREFDAAYNRRDLAALQRLWAGLPAATYRGQFKEAKDLDFRLQILGPPTVTGDTATAACTRTLSYRGQAGGLQTHSERVKVTLGRAASGWIIRSIDLN